MLPMTVTHTKPSQFESLAIARGASATATARLLAMYVVAVASIWFKFWALGDWNVYLQLESRFRFALLEQLTFSAVAGALVASVPFGLFWVFRARAAGRSWLDRFGLLMGIGGAALGWTLLYLSWRVGGDLWTHFRFLGIDGLGYLILGLAALIVSQPAALVLGLFFWSKPFGKAATAAPAVSALLFAVILVVPVVWNRLLA